MAGLLSYTGVLQPNLLHSREENSYLVYKQLDSL